MAISNKALAIMAVLSCAISGQGGGLVSMTEARAEIRAVGAH